MDKSMDKKKKRRILVVIAISLLLVAAVIIFVFLWRWGDDAAVRALGEAEAVMTTKIEVLDGIWDPERQLDEFYYPIGLALNGDDLVVADYMADRIQIIDGFRNIRIGTPGQYGRAYQDSGALVDGFREYAMFRKPAGVFVCPNGDLLVSDTDNHMIRRINERVVISIAGSGSAGYQDGREGRVQFNAPRSAVMCENGFIYVADTMNHCIRRIDTSGNVTLYAGAARQRGYVDGRLSDARFFEPCGLYIDGDGVLLVADSANHAIRKIENGEVTTIVGRPGPVNRLTGYPEGGYVDGDNETALFNFPRGVALMPDDSLLIADSMNHAIRMVTPDGTRTLAGNGMASQFYASAENLKLTRPENLCTDGDTLYVSDSFNNRVLGVPLTERILDGRPSRERLLADTGITTTSRYSYRGDIRVFIDDQRIDMGRVAPWNTADAIFVPIRPLFEALGATMTLDERTNTLTITIQELDTVLNLDRDYFILRGVAVTTVDEIVRLFPYTFEWYPEFSLIALHIPSDLKY